AVCLYSLPPVGCPFRYRFPSASIASYVEEEAVSALFSSMIACLSSREAERVTPYSGYFPSPPSEISGRVRGTVPRYSAYIPAFDVFCALPPNRGSSSSCGGEGSSAGGTVPPPPPSPSAPEQADSGKARQNSDRIKATGLYFLFFIYPIPS